MIPFAHNIIHGIVPAVVNKAVQETEEALRRKEMELRQKYWYYWMLAGSWDYSETIFLSLCILVGVVFLVRVRRRA